MHRRAVRRCVPVTLPSQAPVVPCLTAHDIEAEPTALPDAGAGSPGTRRPSGEELGKFGFRARVALGKSPPMRK